MKETATIKPTHRLWLIGFGLLFGWVGTIRMMRSMVAVRNLHRQPAWSSGLIAIGGFVVLLGLLPRSWLERVAGMPPSKAKEIRRARFHGRRRGKDRQA